ncbi:hypothetical protein [Aliivibrio fischeri]|uniref:hypothetical protein n=1 Tax=Aliivibrio fischeri TaxID=668 RepID=UPI0012D858B9|nr:hypothetical protein [Aliivibrio fischeri]MUK68487.1 hypothetical protein [Aliivibrio fischeri]MUK73211.1 hypothetical protein [Aliivibrio fischeri]MUK76116.1 hypothetical protein [Aliivibrio fischeri]
MNSFLRFLLFIFFSTSVHSAPFTLTQLSSMREHSMIAANNCIDPVLQHYFEDEGITPENSHIKGYGACFNANKHKAKRQPKKHLKDYLGTECADPAFIKLLKDEGINPSEYDIQSSDRCGYKNIS